MAAPILSFCRPGITGDDIRSPGAGTSFSSAAYRPPLRDELVVRALFDDDALVHDDDEIGVADRRQPVRDHERRAAGHQLVDAAPRSGPRLRGRRARSPRRGSGSPGRARARGQTRRAGARPPRSSLRVRRRARRADRARCPHFGHADRARDRARRAALQASTSARSCGLPSEMFSSNVPANSVTSCDTTVMRRAQLRERNVPDIDAVESDRSAPCARRAASAA